MQPKRLDQRRPDQHEKIVDVTFSGSMVVDRHNGRGMTICGKDLESVRRILKAAGSGSNNDSATFYDADPAKVKKFMTTQRVNFAAGSMYSADVIEKSFRDSLRADISNMRSATRASIDKTSQSQQNRTQTPEVLPLDGKADIWVSGPVLKDKKRIGHLEHFANDLVWRLGAKSCTDPNPNGFMIQGADADLLPKLKPDLTYYDNLNLGEKEDLQLKISKKLEFEEGSPDEGSKPTQVKCQKSGKIWKTFRKS